MCVHCPQQAIYLHWHPSIDHCMPLAWVCDCVCVAGLCHLPWRLHPVFSGQAARLWRQGAQRRQPGRGCCAQEAALRLLGRPWELQHCFAC